MLKTVKVKVSYVFTAASICCKPLITITTYTCYKSNVIEYTVVKCKLNLLHTTCTINKVHIYIYIPVIKDAL